MHEPDDAESAPMPSLEVNVYRHGHLYGHRLCRSWEEAADLVESWAGYEATECEVIGPPIARSTTDGPRRGPRL